jgi:5-enolpyruvylshikimate-3-phosphate synthase
MALAAQREQDTRIKRVERTELVARFADFLASGGVNCRWGERAVVVEPEETKPFVYSGDGLDYDAFTYMLVLCATRTGSRIPLIETVDNTVEMLILALRRAGAELDFQQGKPPQVEVQQPISRPIRYKLRKESAKITPQLVTALCSLDGRSEITDLFGWGRFDSLFESMITNFERRSLAGPEPGDELERRLRRKVQTEQEHGSKISVGGGLTDQPSAIDLRPDTEFTAYLVAGTVASGRGKLILRNFNADDMTNSPLSQMKRMGVDFEPVELDHEYGLVVTKADLKSRRIGYEQLHAYPDAVGALALANANIDATTVIRSAPYSTDREEERRRHLCDVIRSLGARVGEIADGIVLEGKKELAAETVDGGGDPFSELTAAAACLGPVEMIEIDDVAAAESRWGSSFRALLQLLQ